MRLLVSLLLLASVVATCESAEPVQYAYTGTVRTVGNDPFPGLAAQPGDPVSGYFRYQPDAVDVRPHPVLGEYVQSTSSVLRVNLGGIRFANEGDFMMRVSNDIVDDPFDPNSQRIDFISLADGDTIVNDPIRANGALQQGNLALQLVDETGSLWNDDSLPAALDLGDFTRTYGQVFLQTSRDTMLYTFSIDTLALIPEPTALALVCLALPMLGIKRRPKRS